MTDQRPSLPFPNDVVGNDAAVEAVRAWMVEGESRIVLKDVFVSPSDWGLLLFDIAKMAAYACSVHRGLDQEKVIGSICERLNAEFEASTRQVSATPVYGQH